MAYTLQFEVIKNSSPEVLVLNNYSVSDAPLNLPLWRIKLPAAINFKSVAVPANPVINITGEDLDIVCVDCETNPLPDGLYEIRLQITDGVTPVEVSKYHLRTNLFREKYKTLLMQIEFSEFRVKEDAIIKQSCLDLDILLEAAEAHADLNSITQATKLFDKATKILTRLIHQVNQCL